MRLYGEIIPKLKRGDYRPYRRTNYALSHLYMIVSVDLAHYGASRAKVWVSVDCITSSLVSIFSSPEHEVLMVSYCDQSLSVVRRASSVVRRQQFVLKANSS